MKEKENEFIEKIEKELIQLEFNVNSIGFVYWLQAIMYIKENPLWYDIMNIYGYIAIQNGDLISRVERNMRTAITPARKNIQEKYCYYKRIRNETFLRLIYLKLIFLQ